MYRWMPDARLRMTHHWAAIVRGTTLPVAVLLIIVALGNDWPKWAVAVTILPTWIAGLVAAFTVIACRWLEERRGWPEPPDLSWSSWWW